jgi:hypothetical protein
MPSHAVFKPNGTSSHLARLAAVSANSSQSTTSASQSGLHRLLCESGSKRLSRPAQNALSVVLTGSQGYDWNVSLPWASRWTRAKTGADVTATPERPSLLHQNHKPIGGNHRVQPVVRRPAAAKAR